MGFTGTFLAALLLLAVLLGAVVLLPAPWNWLIGLAWIAYDTWLLAHHLRRGRLAIAAVPPLPTRTSDPTLAVLIAAHDEAEVILASLQHLHPGDSDEVVVIDDGSADGTAAVVVAAYGLTWSDPDADGITAAGRPGCPVRVLVQPRGGKARALNRGLAATRAAIVVTIDADTRLEPGALDAVRAAFAADAGLGAACGIIEPSCRGGLQARIFAGFQVREYARAFVWRAGWAADGMLVLVSGAFAAYRRDALATVGGFDADSLVEDYEVMYRLHQRLPGFRAGVVGGARAVTDAPAGLRGFLRQRARWFGGFLATLWRYRDMVGDPRHGRLGRWHLRLKTIDTVLPLYGLAAVLVLAAVWLAAGRPATLVLVVIACKMAVDAWLHLAAERAYRRWLGRPGPSPWALPASLAEQLCFQPLRQLGAAAGWLVFLRRSARGGMW